MKRLLTAGLAALLLAACGDDNSTGSGGEPTITLELTDAPGDLAHAWVEIAEVSLVGTDGEVVLFDSTTGLVDLLTLTTTTRELVRDVPVPPGLYNQLRVVIPGGVIESEGGDVYVMGDAGHPEGTASTGGMQCPSCAQSGLKINLPDALALETEAVVLVLDFDVSQSFGKARGQSGRWVMTPKITATDIAASGTITGQVSLAEGAALPECGGEVRSLSDFVPRVTAVDDTSLVKTGTVDSDGSFAIRYIPAGRYTVDYAPIIDFDTESLTYVDVTTSVSQVDIASGAEVSVDYVMANAVCP